MSLREFTAFVARRLPSTVAGVRAAGDPDRVIRTVAVCGGAGDSFLPAAAEAGADVYLTSDLRHHVVAEFVADAGQPGRRRRRALGRASRRGSTGRPPADHAHASRT